MYHGSEGTGIVQGEHLPRPRTATAGPAGPCGRSVPQRLEDAFAYWTGVTVALAVNGSVGAAAVMLYQIVLPALTAKARVPVVPNVWGTPVA